MRSKQATVFVILSVAAIAAVLWLLNSTQASVQMQIIMKRLSQINSSKSYAPPVNKQLSESKSALSATQEAELNTLLADKGNPIPASAKACPGYWELRGINFQHPVLSQRLCKDQVAYKMVDSKFPPCEISGNLPPKLLKRLNKTAVKTYIRSSVTGRNVIIYTYPAEDVVSGSVILTHSWEGNQVSLTLSIAKKFPAGSVTFMDIGCNIGVYSLQAREADIPTMAVDASLRNLARIRMSANDMGWTSDPKLKLMWMYFHKSVSLQYLSFGTGSCNVGGATSNKGNIVDTIPVMTGQADDLFESVKTELVVMKIDIETSEHIFFSTGERLFKEKKIVAVQMEFWKSDLSKPAHTSPNFKQIAEFFTRHNYTLCSMGNINLSLNLWTFHDWDGIWIRNDYLDVVRSKP